MARMLGLAAAQVAPVVNDPDRSLEKLEEVVLAIADTVSWVDLICFPELFVTGLHQFVDSSAAPSMAEMAQPVPGPLTERFGALARRTRRWLVPGTFYERDGDTIYNSAVAISPRVRWWPITASYTRGCRSRERLLATVASVSGTSRG
jgi:formamidase